MASTSRWLLSEWVEMMNGKGYVSVISWLAKMMEACGLLGGVIQGFQLGVGDSGLAEDRQGFSRAQLVITPVQNTEDRLETLESPSLTPVFVQKAFPYSDYQRQSAETTEAKQRDRPTRGAAQAQRQVPRLDEERLCSLLPQFGVPGTKEAQIRRKVLILLWRMLSRLSPHLSC